MKILVVEDEQRVAQFIQKGLKEEGHAVDCAYDGEEGGFLAEVNEYDLIILDLMLPKKNGLTVCAEIRERGVSTPVLMLTARDAVQDKVRGLDAGADDYLTKPFNLDEFLLRISGILRRSAWYRPQAAPERHYVFGGNTVNLHEGSARTGQGEIVLTEHEVKLLRTFFQREGEIISRSDLLVAAWGIDPDTETRTLDNFIVRLRKYFENDPSTPDHFQTIRGRGYRFVKDTSLP